MLLADAAQEVNGKLYILGGGWSQLNGPAPTAIAMKIDVPWNEANARHAFRLTLSDEDGQEVRVGPASDGQVQMVAEGGAPVEIQGEFVVGRPPDAVVGADLPNPMALSFGPLPLRPGAYTWRLWIDEQSQPEWHCSFRVVG